MRKPRQSPLLVPQYEHYCPNGVFSSSPNYTGGGCEWNHAYDIIVSNFYLHVYRQAYRKGCILRKYKFLVGYSSVSHEKVLRRNRPEVRETSCQKPSTKIICIALQTSAPLFEISSPKKSSLATPNVEKEC